MKTLILFLLAFPLYAAEIDSVRVGVNTMLISGSGLAKVAKAQLGKKPVAVTGQEFVDRPVPPEVIPPTPVGVQP